MNPYMNPSLINKGLSLTKTINWGAILDGTQKTLGVINQAIPIVYQVKPIISNAKTLFKVANIINEPTAKKQTVTVNTALEEKEEPITKSTNSPIFYI